MNEIWTYQTEICCSSHFHYFNLRLLITVDLHYPQESLTEIANKIKVPAIFSSFIIFLVLIELVRVHLFRTTHTIKSIA